MTGSKAGFAQLIGNRILKLRVPILCLFIIASIVLGYFAMQFKVNASADTLLTKNNQLYIKTQLVNQKFSPAEFILIGYQPKNHALFSQKTFDDLSELTNEFQKLARLESSNSLLNVPIIEHASDLAGGAKVGDLTYKKQGFSIEKMKGALKDHPIYTDLLINKQQTATAIQLVFKANPELDALNDAILSIQKELLSRELSNDEQQQIDELKQQASVIEEELGKQRLIELEKIESILLTYSDEANLYIGGSYVVGLRLVEIVKSDLVYFGSGIAILICVLLAALFRSIKWVIFPILACGTSISFTMGILALLGIPATVISANFVALQLILTLAIMLHLITCYREVSRDNSDWEQSERLQETMKQKVAPCFYAAITTSVGFGSLLLSGIQPIIDFGIMMLISTGVTLVVALVVFPAVMSYLPVSKESPEYDWIQRMLTGLKNSISRFGKLFILVPVSVFIALSVGIFHLNVENSFIDYFDKDTKIYEELSFIDTQFGGSTPLDIVIQLQRAKAQTNAESTDLFLNAESINQLHLSHAVTDAFEATGNVTSLINFTKLGKQINGGQPLTEYELDAIYKLVDKDVIDKLIGAYYDEESKTLRISTRIQDSLPDFNREQFLQLLKNDLKASGLKDDEYQLTNLFVLYQDILSRLFNSQITTLGFVYIALALILLVIFRSIKIALIALLPNIITTTAILGLIGWLGIPLDLMTITIAAIAMGIAVDDTIHFVDAYLSAPVGDGLNAAFSHTGLAITYTSSLIALGFGMFIFSDFMPSVYFGLLTACAMLFALFADITLLPALLQKFVKKEA